VEKVILAKVFHISTAPIIAVPVEMWKTPSQIYAYKRFIVYPYCGKLFDPKVG
jgi:hypothetical protein